MIRRGGGWGRDLVTAGLLGFAWALGFSYLLWGDEEKGLFRPESLEVLVGCCIASCLVASAFRLWVRRRGFWNTFLAGIVLTYVGTIACGVCSVVVFAIIDPTMPGADPVRDTSRALVELPAFAVMAATFYAYAAVPIGAASVVVLRWGDQPAAATPTRVL